MIDIINELKNIKSSTPTKLLDVEVLEKLEKSEYPIFLWGCGNYAEYIYQILKRNNIKLEGVFVDQKIIDKKFHQYDVISFEQVKNKYKKINIVRGNGNIERESYFREIELVDSVYSFFDLMGFGWNLNDELIQDYSKIINEMFNKFEDNKSRESFKAYIKSRYFNDWNYIQPYVCQNMYFPEFIKISNEESIIDCGAFDGDTLKLLQKKTTNWKNYIAFEPSNMPYDMLKKYIEKNQVKNIKTFKLGVWNKKTTLSFVEDNDISRILEGSVENGTKIQVDTIDNICSDIKVTYIKMDLEGSELIALQGAKDTVLKNRPKLAVSIYHKPSDLIDIYRFIKDMKLEYKFYFRIHTKIGTDAVLYAL
jgi:FkbM family methyltransferase